MFHPHVSVHQVILWSPVVALITLCYLVQVNIGFQWYFGCFLQIPFLLMIHTWPLMVSWGKRIFNLFRIKWETWVIHVDSNDFTFKTLCYKVAKKIVNICLFVFKWDKITQSNFCTKMKSDKFPHMSLARILDAIALPPSAHLNPLPSFGRYRIRN